MPALVLVPVAGGVAVRTFASAWYADRLVAVGSCVGGLLIPVIIGLGLDDPENIRMLEDATWEVFFTTTMLGLIGATLGYVSAHLMGQRPRQCRAISFETGIQSAPLTLGIVQATFLTKGFGKVGEAGYSADDAATCAR